MRYPVMRAESTENTHTQNNHREVRSEASSSTFSCADILGVFLLRKSIFDLSHLVSELETAKQFIIQERRTIASLNEQRNVTDLGIRIVLNPTQSLPKTYQCRLTDYASSGNNFATISCFN